MKNEAQLCSIISGSIQIGHKIPDPNSAYNTTSIRCFDGLGLLPESTFTNSDSNNLVFVPWEAKYLKEMSAFSFSRVEPHQDYFLSNYGKALNIYPLLIVGITVGRGDQRAYVFDYNSCGHALYERRFSIHKKFLEKFKYNEIHKNKFEFKNIIKKEDFISAYEDKNFWNKLQA